MSIKCFLCGGTVVWQSDESAEQFGYEDDGTISFFECQDCGAFYEVSLIVNRKVDGNGEEGRAARREADEAGQV